MHFPKLYFAHPVTDCGTAAEAVWLQYLGQNPASRIYSILNPGDPAHQKAIATIIDSEKRMEWCLHLVDICQALAFAALPAWVNGRTPIGADVWTEIKRAHSDGKSIFWLQGGRGGYGCELIRITDLQPLLPLCLSPGQTYEYMSQIRTARGY